MLAKTKVSTHQQLIISIFAIEDQWAPLTALHTARTYGSITTSRAESFFNMIKKHVGVNPLFSLMISFQYKIRSKKSADIQATSFIVGDKIEKAILAGRTEEQK